MKKIIVLGSNGMAGHIITLYLLEQKKYEIYDFCHNKKIRKESINVDVTNTKALNLLFEEIKPDIVINCIGILKENCDKNLLLSSFINSFFPKYLEKYFKNSSCKIIHLSTDCVFDGRKGSYIETDIKNATDIYGITKGMGEIINEKDLTIRTSIIGPEIKDGESLFDWFMKQEGAIDGYENVWWTGVTTLELAKIIDYIIENNISGLYHIIPKEKINKFTLLSYIKDIFKKDKIKIYKEIKTRLDKSLLTTKSDFKYVIKNYKEMILELYEWMKNRPKYYQKYFEIKDKVIIVWSKIKALNLTKEKANLWVKYRIKIFMNYTYKSFKNQTNQNFYYFIHCDEVAAPIVFEELKNYTKLPDNIKFTNNYYKNISEILPFYKTLYFVRIDSDDMYDKNFIQRLVDYKHNENTQALIAQSGYTYDIINDKLARWYYKSPPFYTLIYNSFDFSNGYRYEVHGHSSVINLNHEILNGDNFIVIVHSQNTITVFNTSFRKQIIEGEEMNKIKKEFDLKPMINL